MHNRGIKKTIILTSICSVVATLLILFCAKSISDYVVKNKDWRSREELGRHAPFTGRIVHIADYEDGYILYVDTNGVTSANHELFEVWVYDDTVLVGEAQGVQLQNMVSTRTPGAYVTMECFEGTTNILEDHFLYPAMIVSIEEEPIKTP